MAKRKQPEASPEVAETPSKRRRKTTEVPTTNGIHNEEEEAEAIPKPNNTPKKQETPSRRKRKSAAEILVEEEEEEGNDAGSPTPKANGRTLFSTPRRTKKHTNGTPSKSKANNSARRKSARALAEQDEEEDDWDGQAALAREILEDEDGQVLVEAPVGGEQDENETTTTPVQTPSRGRGRPKGARNRRSPTPEGNIPPEERYFFQNRAGPPQISNNKFTSVKLLTHDEYYEHIQSYTDRHDADQARLMNLHARSFPQWKFEMSQGFGLCLYGYGSKRALVTKFAEYLYKTASKPASSHHPPIVIVNGYTPKLSVRHILNTVASAIVGEDETLRLVGQPHEMLDTLFAHLTAPVTVMINSIDAGPLRRGAVQSVLARLADHHMVSFLATADSPTFAAMWNSTLLDRFRFVYHDCTTFAAYSAEINVVDDVHELLGRKRMRIGGKEGIGFVLRSLPENARNLYRLLLSEILTILVDGIDGDGATTTATGFDDEDDNDNEAAAETEAGPRRISTTAGRAAIQKGEGAGAEEVGVEYRTLYEKASTDFICSSSMNFQFLLKEFHDHQLITSRRDATGTQLLGVPLGREEMEAVLEDLS
ncbi:Origin recognition complex subunit 2 [Exophiala xenobiotica]|nr:Origin recognition complex subunit 2 [Exophiala xenobiotica]KAK5272262.1 Origin recognition complex subunit 2 [Exophiala xenobiotica]KAK5342055.1 Origin recognition complex subunit 2 [Exophiala xenobiotica]KAK5367192.1 Origin recognition complex subunit 2 [Exophiala xenobiotica]KAK5401280.1 Origin recognition complex subunit 2 [Exophiala xenobiotica]